MIGYTSRRAYRDDYVSLFHGDFRGSGDAPFGHGRGGFGDRTKARLALFDPPYGVGKSIVSCEMGEDEALELMISAIDWGLEHAETVICTIGTFKNQRRVWAERPPEDVYCWYKFATPKLSKVGFSDWEPVFVYGRAYGPAHNFLACKPIRLGTFGHPCPKPLGWAKFFVERHSKPGDLIVDCFAGSGTTLVAAKALGRRAIGFEIRLDYCAIAVDRLKQEPLPGLIATHAPAHPTLNFGD
jgi:hypothetical protein